MNREVGSVRRSLYLCLFGLSLIVAFGLGALAEDTYAGDAQPGEGIGEPVDIDPSAEDAPALLAEPYTVDAGQTITVRFRGAPGHDQDWISMFREGADNRSYGEWYYLRGQREGQLTFTAPSEPGVYEFRMFCCWAVGGYEDIAVSNKIGVGEAPGSAHVLHPGEVTELEGGLLIIPHPRAIDRPIMVEAEWFVLPYHDTGVPVLDRFVRIRALDLPPEELWVDTPIDTGFFVAIPVPEEFDLTRLAAFEYVYGDSMTGENPHDVWLWTGGVYDPKYNAFVFELEELGGGEYPTQLGIVEHDDDVPLRSDEIIDQIQRYLSGEGADMALYAATNPGTVAFDVWHRCGTGSAGCNADVDAEVRAGLRTDANSAYTVYRGMYGDPSPMLKTTDKFGSGRTYVYYIYSDAATLPWRYLGLVNGNPCPPDRLGMYVRFGRRAWTCASAYTPSDLGRATTVTQHELFHAFQWSYPFYSPITGYELVAEGTARLAEDHTDPLGISGRETVPVVDVPLTDQRPYRAEYFFHDLFHRSGLQFRDMGKLFDEGLRVPHLNTFIEDETPFAGYWEAHWAWVRNAVFDADINPDGAYGNRCQINRDVFRADPLPGVLVSASRPVDAITISVRGHSAILVEIDLPELDRDHYYTVNVGGTTAPMARLYTQEMDEYNGECLQCNATGIYVVHDATKLEAPFIGDLAVIYCAASAHRRTAYLLIQNPQRNTTHRFEISVIGPHFDMDPFDTLVPSEAVVFRSERFVLETRGLIGRSGEDTHFVGESMPSGCMITDVKVEKVTRGEWLGPDREISSSYTGLSAGVRITNDGVGTNSLEVGVRHWRDAGRGLDYRIVYYVEQPCGVICDPRAAE